MRKTIFLIAILSIQLSFSQSYYGYERRENTGVDMSKITQKVADDLKAYANSREKAARDLGWSSAAEMDAARRKNRTKLRNERKMRALQYRINKKKKKAELRRIKKENRLKLKKPKS
jgi:hypothetical protein